MPKNRVDTCIICEQVACRCGQPAKKVTARKPRLKKEAPVPSPAASPQATEQVSSTEDPFDGAAVAKQSARAAMKARAGRSRTAQPVTAPVRSQPTSRQSDPIMDAAIMAAAPLMSPEEKARHKDVLWANSPAMLRALEWRQRRANV